MPPLPEALKKLTVTKLSTSSFMDDLKAAFQAQLNGVRQPLPRTKNYPPLSPHEVEEALRLAVEHQKALMLLETEQLRRIGVEEVKH
jgi:hypothetical protein